MRPATAESARRKLSTGSGSVPLPLVELESASKINRAMGVGCRTSDVGRDASGHLRGQFGQCGKRVR